MVLSPCMTAARDGMGCCCCSLLHTQTTAPVAKKALENRVLCAWVRWLGLHRASSLAAAPSEWVLVDATVNRVSLAAVQARLTPSRLPPHAGRQEHPLDGTLHRCNADRPCGFESE